MGNSLDSAAISMEAKRESSCSVCGGWAGSERKILFIALSLAFIATAAFQGSRGLYETTEGRYTLCARETLDRGDLTEPMLNGNHHWTKPPLTYAAIAAGLAVFGDNTWGARAYLVVFFVLTAWAVYLIGAQIWNRRVGAFAALVYATSPFPIAAANAVSTDTLLTLWYALSILFYWMARRRLSGLYMCAMWLAIGIGCLTKGPLGILPLFGIVPFHWLMRRREPDQPWLFNPAGLALFAVVGMGWFLWKSYKYPGLMQYWFLHETVGRLAKGEFDRNPQFYKAFAIYLPVLLFGAFQWAMVFAVKRRQIPWPAGQWRRPFEWKDGPEWVFLLLSFVFPFLFFMISKSRLALYILPLFVLIALALGRGVAWLHDSGRLSSRAVFVLAVACVLVMAGAKGVHAHMENAADMAKLSAALKPIREQYPQHKFYVAKKLRLNGLEFYMHEDIPQVDIEDIPRIVEEAKNAAVVPLILVTNKEAAQLGSVGLESLFEAQKVNKFWAVLKVK